MVCGTERSRLLQIKQTRSIVTQSEISHSSVAVELDGVQDKLGVEK